MMKPNAEDERASINWCWPNQGDAYGVVNSEQQELCVSERWETGAELRGGNVTKRVR